MVWGQAAAPCRSSFSFFPIFPHFAFGFQEHAGPRHHRTRKSLLAPGTLFFPLTRAECEKSGSHFSHARARRGGNLAVSQKHRQAGPSQPGTHIDALGEGARVAEGEKKNRAPRFDWQGASPWSLSFLAKKRYFDGGFLAFKRVPEKRDKMRKKNQFTVSTRGSGTRTDKTCALNVSVAAAGGCGGQDTGAAYAACETGGTSQARRGKIEAEEENVFLKI